MPASYGTDTGFGNDTLSQDPPSGFTVIGDAGSWIIVSDGADPAQVDIQYAVRRDYSGTSDSHLRLNSSPSEVFNDKYSLKILVKVSASMSGSFILALNPDSAEDTYIYGIALRPNSGHFDIVKFTDLHTVSDLATSTFTFDSDTWYTVHFKKDGTTLEASIWEWGETEPSWMVSTTDASYSWGTTCKCRMVSIDTVDADVSWLSERTGTSPAADPPDPIPGVTGEGQIRWNWTVFANDDFLIEGQGNIVGIADFEFSEFYLYGGMVLGGSGDVDFETFDISGHGGGNALLEFPEPTVNAYGYIWNKGNGAVEYGLDDDDVEINGYGNNCGEVDFSEAEVDATGIMGRVGDAEVDFGFSVSGTGLTEICTVGECGVFFPLASISASGKLEILGRGSLDFPLSAILGSGLLSILGNGELPFPPATISGSGSVLPLGDGELFFEFDVQGFGESEESSSILRYKQYGYD